MVRASSGIFDTEQFGGQKMELGYFRQVTGITDNFPITKDMPSVLYLKATAARDVLLPAVDAEVEGRVIHLYNEGTGVITLKTSSDAALTPARTVSGNGAIILHAILGVTAVNAWKTLSVT